MGITDTQKKQLDEQGCIVIPDVFSDEEIEVYRADILRLAEEEKQNGLARQHTDGYGQHIRWLVNKGEMYEKMVAHPKVMPFFEHVLGPDYTLSTLTSNIIDPGAADGGYHVDSVLGTMPEPLPSFHWLPTVSGCLMISHLKMAAHAMYRVSTSNVKNRLPARHTIPMKFVCPHRKAQYFCSTVRFGILLVLTKPMSSVLR